MVLAPLLIIVYWSWIIIAIAAHLAISVLVYRDAKTLLRSALGISPFLWFSISIILPIGGMFVYWLMNHSSLNKENYRI
ncbi:hypothetical protein [Desulfolucanica intricata]|uniref:hypothetical protein n=1 Tax=Desulfolucanica intricata TaxID=1285191 RepID=UPI0008328C2D|nr:hypothetical protein [Desulfolucanica intricata]